MAQEQAETRLEERMRAVEDRLAIYNVVCGYGYAVDGCNAEVVGSLYAEDGVYAVGDIGAYEGRQAIADITTHESHLQLVRAGCAHVSTLPYVVITGDRAVATCHTMVVSKVDGAFTVVRLSASRLELSRIDDGRWQIDRRTNALLDGDKAGPDLLARLTEGPQSS